MSASMAELMHRAVRDPLALDPHPHGSARPFAFHWTAVVHDTFPHDGRTLPRGALVVYREYYGMQPGKPNVGLKLPAEEVALVGLDL